MNRYSAAPIHVRPATTGMIRSFIFVPPKAGVRREV
jgi:hypothetical protein